MARSGDVAAFAPRLQGALKALGPARIDVFIEELLEPSWNDILAHTDPTPCSTSQLEPAGRLHRPAALHPRAGICRPRARPGGLGRARPLEGRASRSASSSRLPNAPRQEASQAYQARPEFRKTSDEERHELRLDLKKLPMRSISSRHFLLFAGRKVKEGRKLLARLQDRLGEANDLAECRLRIDELLARDDLGADRFEVAKAAGFLRLGWHAAPCRRRIPTSTGRGTRSSRTSRSGDETVAPRPADGMRDGRNERRP
ncbi:MAG: CHAD domain-containing protein [Geminicoccaceae bacterium]